MVRKSFDIELYSDTIPEWDVSKRRRAAGRVRHSFWTDQVHGCENDGATDVQVVD